ncbi:MAG: hypothetical protein OEV78_04260 [Spirochaetia bacterium]|nr:hypothetical protein [Spirochaetia bacterium]
MKKLMNGFLIFGFLVTSVSINAGEFADLKAKIGGARDAAISMLKDKNKRGVEQQKSAKEIAESVTISLNKMIPPSGKEAIFNELRETWMAFKKTREEEVIPLILEGKEDSARKIAESIQKERLKKLYDLCDELDK